MAAELIRKGIKEAEMITNKAVLEALDDCPQSSLLVLARTIAALQDYRARNGMETDYVGCGGCCGGCNRTSHHDENSRLNQEFDYLF